MSMEELELVNANHEAAEAAGILPEQPNEIPKKRVRKARKLTWNERQYGAGFINGLWCGITLGIPLAAGLAALAKLFVGWLMVW